jgi:predicted DNA-binding transcriptional regulator AlpA
MASTIVKEKEDTSRRSIKMLRLHDVEERVGYKRTRIYTLVAKDKFPPPVKLGARRIAWPEYIIDEYLSKKIEDSQRQRAPAQKEAV